MSMNFGREQSLLRQRLQAKGSAASAAKQQESHGTAQTFLGATEEDVAAAAHDLAAAFPAMGRAQMTAFVRTLWKSRIHELRAAGVHLLALRHHLLEPADLPFLEELLRDEAVDGVLHQLADQVLGNLVLRHKKLWKDLQRFTGTERLPLHRAAARACRVPLHADAEAFPRFAALAANLLGTADAAVQTAIDEALRSAAALHHAAASTFVREHGRQVHLPPPAPAPVAATPVVAKIPAERPGRAAPEAVEAPARAPKKATASKPKAPKPNAGKGKKATTTGKPPAGKPPAGKPAQKKAASDKATGGRAAQKKPAGKKGPKPSAGKKPAGKLAARTR